MKTLAFTALLAAALVSGCASRPAWMTGGDERQAASLVDYANRVAAMDAGAQRRERDWSVSAQAKDRSTLARVRLGMLYALPASAIQDDARALPLLENTGDDGPLGQVARLVAAQVRERQRQVLDEQKKAELLKQQLEALKAIERSILERADRRRVQSR